MKTKPYVGQEVVLNDTGLYVIYGSSDPSLSYLKTKVMKITLVEALPLPIDNKTVYGIEVDDLDINKFIFDSGCFDEAK